MSVRSMGLLAANTPAWTFLRSAFAMDPLDERLSALNTALKDIWLKQVMNLENNEAVVRNAATFGIKLNDADITTQLSKTDLGKAVLKKTKRQFNYRRPQI